VHEADALAIRLGSKAGEQQNLDPRSDEPEEVITDYAGVLIAIMNRALRQRFGDEYKPVMYDNRRSAATVAKLKAAKVPLRFARIELEKHCRLFNPSKHGRGRLPGTLGYFEKGLLRAHEANCAQSQFNSKKAGSNLHAHMEAIRGGQPQAIGSLLGSVIGETRPVQG
jgi:hypothetical protein